ncbi:hypothetical protein ACFQY4_27160 [Catellatospora bangladeshensis]|uniref:hypothetical protein n=1 Tax=Catellatospora bangladeshensis TaxID=310355 RepID=UPI00361C11BA
MPTQPHHSGRNSSTVRAASPALCAPARVVVIWVIAKTQIRSKNSSAHATRCSSWATGAVGVSVGAAGASGGWVT